MPALFGFLVFSFLSLISMLWSEYKLPRTELSPISKTRIMQGLSLVFIKGVLIGGLVVVAGYSSLQYLFSFQARPDNWIFILVAVMLTDLAYYFIHRFLNHGRGSNGLTKWYRRNHAMHHSIEALDFFRGNISSLIDTAITGFQIPLILIGSVLNLSLMSLLIAYVLILLLQGTHHVNHSFDIGWLRFVFVENDNHRLHHGKRGCFVNYAAVFSIWDRLFGTHAPQESFLPVLIGCLMHFGPGVILYGVGVWTGFEPIPLLITFFVVSSLAMNGLLVSEKMAPRVQLTPISIRDMIVGISHVFVTAIIAGTAVVIAGWWMLHHIWLSPIQLPAWASVVLAVILSDFIYYFLHRYLNHGNATNGLKKWLRKNHHIHHSMPALDFMRGSVSSFADTVVTGFQVPLWINYDFSNYTLLLIMQSACLKKLDLFR